MLRVGPDGEHVVVDAWGEDPTDALANHMHLRPQRAPDPASLAEDDVVIAVQACAVGWVDLIMASGQYQHAVQPPYTPGLEFTGEVAWVGPAVEGVAVGDRVLADGLKTGPRSRGRHNVYGGFASWAVAPAAAVLPLPDALTYAQGCCLLGNWETAYHGLVVRGRVQPGETVLVNGASGSTGLAAVQLAKELGATVIATGRNLDKLAEVKRLGADHVVQAPDFRAEVKALTDDRGVDVVWDGVGGSTTRESLRCVRFGARYLIIGWASTPDVADGGGRRGAPRANQLPTNLVMMKGLDVLGCPAVISTRFDPSLRPRRLAQIMAWVDEGRVVPHVGATYGFEAWDEALRAKWTSRHVGGCVLLRGR